MSRFPAQICVKRKANEEPVEALYLQTQRQPKRALTEIAYRLWTEKRSPSRRRDSRSDHFTPPQVPKIRTSHLDEGGNQSRNQVPAKSAQSQALLPPLPIRTALHDTTQVPRRVFHLSKAHADLPSVSLDESSGTQKRKRDTKTKLATFIEGPRAIKKPRSILDLNGSANNEKILSGGQFQNTADDSAPKQTTQPPKQIQRKRPGASAVERKWRSETWDQKPADSKRLKESTANDQDGAWTESPLKLAQELHKLGLQETRLESSTKDTADQQSASKKPPKYKPKVPTQRYADRHPEEAAGNPDHHHETRSLADEDEDYVMDVYVMEPERQEAAPINEDSPQTAAQISKQPLPLPENIGIIIIAEDEEELWREFAEINNEEQEENSEDEDENESLQIDGITAEDFYANDYPEEELDSDDEFGRNPYKFRSNPSDTEDFEDEDEDDAWSETDYRHHPWARHPWEVRP